MRVWRLANEAHAGAPLDGEGARRHGGRWNHRGIALAYASTSPALAVLEVLVHVDAGEFPDGHVIVCATLPDDAPISRVSPDDLPTDWFRYPAPETLQDIGAAWARAGNDLALLVPSAIVPIEDFNILINPTHPDAQRIGIAYTKPFTFDPRLLSVAP